MRNLYLVVTAILVGTALGHAQARGGGRGGEQAQPRQQPSSPGLVLYDGWGRPVVNPLAGGKKPGPAPRRDISGIWEPTAGAGAGIQANGPYSMPSDGIHEPPYTDAGKQSYQSHKPLFGHYMVLPSLSNDPRNHCDPLGFPRADFYQLRHTQFVQTPNQVFILYQFDKRFRTIWTDGRELPKELPDNRYYGYSVGKWADDTTFVVNTTGLVGNEKVWLDETGRPMSDEMSVEERFHRVDFNNMEITVTVTDPKFYSKPWVAMDKFPMRLQSPDYDVLEMLCIPSEMEGYSKDFGDPASGLDGK
jgi:hypothetical protein